MMLSMVDLKQKRFLNEQDFVQLFARNDRLCEDRAKYIFKLIDIDSDGRISYNEFLQIVRNRRLLWPSYFYISKIIFIKCSTFVFLSEYIENGNK